MTLINTVRSSSEKFLNYTFVHKPVVQQSNYSQLCYGVYWTEVSDELCIVCDGVYYLSGHLRHFNVKLDPYLFELVQAKYAVRASYGVYSHVEVLRVYTQVMHISG